jgi:hypothetical protein
MVRFLRDATAMTPLMLKVFGLLVFAVVALGVASLVEEGWRRITRWRARRKVAPANQVATARNDAQP